MPQTKIHLSPAFFGEKEKILVERGPLSASTFCFPGRRRRPAAEE